MIDNPLKTMYQKHVARTQPNRTEKLNHVLNVVRLGVWAGVRADEIMRDLLHNGVAVDTDHDLRADLRSTIKGMQREKCEADRKARND